MMERLKALISKATRSGASKVRRSPILYSPPTTTDVNWDRLPPAAATANMELAYRQASPDDEELRGMAKLYLLFVFLICLLAAMMSVITAPFISFNTGLATAGGIAFALTFVVGSKGPTSAFSRGALIASPVVAFVVFQVVGRITSSRMSAAMLFSLVTFVFFAIEGKRPFVFYRSWIYAHHRLTPEARRRMEDVSLRPRLSVLALILLITIFVPELSPTLAILGIAGVCLAVLRRELLGLRRVFHRLMLILGQYITYGDAASLAPGVWVPEQSLGKRHLGLWKIAVPLFLSLTVGLYMFCPADWVASSIERDIKELQAYCDRARESGDSIDFWRLAAMRPRDFDSEAFFSTPYGWMRPVLDSMSEGNTGYAWVFLLVAVFVYALPMLVLLALYSRPVNAITALRESVEGSLAQDRRPEWQCYVDRLRQSRHTCEYPPMKTKIEEAAHLFAGVEPYAQFPVLLHENVLSEHCYIVGESGSGKTSLGIMPLLIQLIRGRFQVKDHRETITPPPPIVVLDLKGDPALFQVVREELLRRREQAKITEESDPRYAFRFFTPEKNKASHFFNPFQSFASEARSDIQLCHLFLDALNLNHGEGYGRSYYSRRNRLLLYHALTKDPKPQSILELSERLMRLTERRRPGEGVMGQTDYKQDSFELVSTIQALAEYPMLATSGNLEHPEHAIYMPDLLEHRQVAYFWLPAALESISVREIGKLALFALLTAAIDRQRAGGEHRQVYLVIDEFQRIAGENFKVILEQARSFGISAILANQTQSDLRTHDIDLRPTVRANTRAKMYFGLSDNEEIKTLSEMSGEEVAILMGADTSIRTTDKAMERPWGEWLKPRMTRNEILKMTDHPLQYVLHVSRGEGYSQFAGLPVLCQTQYPMEKGDYEKLQKRPWPEGQIHTTVAKKSPEEHDAEVKIAAQEQLASLFESFG